MYATQAHYIERFGQRELDQVLDPADGRSFEAMSSDASATIDSHLLMMPGRTFAVPLTTAPQRIIELAADLVRYELWGQAASQEIKDRHTAALEFLRALAKGEAAVSGLAENSTPVAGLAYAARPRVFTDETLAGF